MLAAGEAPDDLAKRRLSPCGRKRERGRREVLKS
jgi:hypothetical protein